MAASNRRRRRSADRQAAGLSGPDPAPLGTGSRRWTLELWEIHDNGDGHLLTCGGEYPSGSVPPEWRAEWWMTAARACHDMAMRCEHEARQEAV